MRSTANWSMCAKSWLIAVLAACSLAEIRDAQCLTACQWAGYDGGYYRGESSQCACVDLRGLSAMLERKAKNNAARPKRDPWSF